MRHPVFARVYARRSAKSAAQQAGYRQALLAGLAGRVLEIGCGNGLNFEHYPPEVTELVAIEPEAYLRRLAEEAPMSVPTKVRGGTAETIGTSLRLLEKFDAVVFSLVLCSVKDPSSVLHEAKRVARPGAEFRFYEHILSANPKVARMQKLFAPLWARAAGNCHPDRNLLFTVGRLLRVTSVEAFDVRLGPALPYALVASHVLIQAKSD